MRRWTLALGLVVATLALVRCGGTSGGGTDSGTTQGADAGAAGPDGSLTPASCTPITNAGCDAGVCSTTSVSQLGAEEFACGTPGPGGDYAACTSSLDCQEKFSCLSLLSETSKTCHQYCTASFPCPGTATSPEACTTFTAGATTGYCVRVTACDIFKQDCAGTTLGCYPIAGGGGCVTAGTKAPGAACDFDQQCEKGAVCQGAPAAAVEDGGTAGTTKTCAKLCDLSGVAGADGGTAATCTGPQTCTAVQNHTYGICQ